MLIRESEYLKFFEIKKKRKQRRPSKIKINYNLIILGFIILSSIILFYFRKIYRTTKSIHKFTISKNNDKTWFKGNATEIIDTYKNLVPNKNDRQFFKQCTQEISLLKIYSDDDEKNIKLLRDKFSEKFKKNVRFVKNIFLKLTCGFGNQICSLNNIIFYSEILGIKNIYLNAAYNNWYIKDKVITDKISISLTNQSQIDCNSEDTICGHIYYDFFFPVIFKPTTRAIILKDEIKRNMPQINTDEDDLYIYIRAGDVFEKTGNSYSPAPYCFYQKILSQFTFKNIYLISMDDKNPIIGRLLSDYPKIIHQFHSFEQDFSTIMNAHNLVNSYSSFAQAGIFFNDKINNLWEYDFYKMIDKVYHYHHDLHKLNREFYIYKMKPSENYTNIMFNWRNEGFQRKFLFDENCKYGFIKTKSTETLF